MTQKPILKNVNKFSKIKLAKGIDVKKLHFTTRSKKEIKELGVSTKDYGKVWFVMPDGTKALFKTYNIDSTLKNKKLRMVNELLCYQLCKQIDMPCAKYEPAHIDKQVGLISYNFLKDGEYTKSLFELLKIDKTLSGTLTDTLEALDQYQEMGYSIDKRNILKNLYKFIIFDTITLQSDRHEGNIQFIFNEDTAEIKLAPAFDNEYAFSIDIAYKMYKKNKDNEPKSIDDLRDEYSLWAKYFTVMDELRSTKMAFINNVKYICAIAKADKEFNSILNRFLTNINPKAAFVNLEKQGISVPEEYKEYVTTIIKENIKEIKTALKNVAKDDKEYFEEEVIR